SGPTSGNVQWSPFENPDVPDDAPHPPATPASPKSKIAANIDALWCPVILPARRRSWTRDHRRPPPSASVSRISYATNARSGYPAARGVLSRSELGELDLQSPAPAADLDRRLAHRPADGSDVAMLLAQQLDHPLAQHAILGPQARQAR